MSQDSRHCLQDRKEAAWQIQLGQLWRGPAQGQAFVTFKTWLCNNLLQCQLRGIVRFFATMGNSPAVQSLPRYLVSRPTQLSPSNVVWTYPFQLEVIPGCLECSYHYSLGCRCKTDMLAIPTFIARDLLFHVCSGLFFVPRIVTWHSCTTRKGSCAANPTALKVGPMPTTCQAWSPSPSHLWPEDLWPAGEADRSIGAWRQWLAKAQIGKTRFDIS